MKKARNFNGFNNQVTNDYQLLSQSYRFRQGLFGRSASGLQTGRVIREVKEFNVLMDILLTH